MRVRQFGWVYLPRSVLSWVVAVGMAAFCVSVFLAVDRKSHSVSDTLYGIFPYWSLVFLLWNWFGAQLEKGQRS